MSDKLVNKIVEKAVLPQLNKVAIDYIGVVETVIKKTSINGDTQITFCNVSAFNEKTGQQVLLPDVPCKINSPWYKIHKDPEIGDYVEIGFTNGNMNTPFIRRIISEKELKDMASQEQPNLY
jgi:hypothetical protein